MRRQAEENAALNERFSDFVRLRTDTPAELPARGRRFADGSAAAARELAALRRHSLRAWNAASLEAGMPQRYVAYDEVFARLQTLQLIGYFVTLISVLAFAICIGEAIYRRIKTGKEPPETHDRAVRHF